MRHMRSRSISRSSVAKPDARLGCVALLSPPGLALLERLHALTEEARAAGRSAWLRPELTPEESGALLELRRERLVEEQARGAGLHDSRWVTRKRETYSEVQVTWRGAQRLERIRAGRAARAERARVSPLPYDPDVGVD